MLDRTETNPTIVLNDLARRIDAEHGQVATALRSALYHAILAGELLKEAKDTVKHGQWLKWLTANCNVPRRTAAHYMHLARERQRLCDDLGNVLPISVNAALDWIKHPAERGFEYSEWGEYQPYRGWGCAAWGAPFNQFMQTVTHIDQLKPPAVRYVVRAARAGKTPGLTAPALYAAIALLQRYADAIALTEDRDED